MPTENARLRLFARLFTRPTFVSLAKSKDWRYPLAYLQKHGLLRPDEPRPLSTLFDTAWEELKNSYRNEYVYKNEIANRIAFGRHRPHTASFHVELPVGRSIVDVAVFNGTSTAYEIKTEYDSARRLQSQTNDYLKAFSQVYVVTHPTLAQEYKNTVDESVGILALSRDGSLQTLRHATLDLTRLDQPTMFRCLRRAEYESALGTRFRHVLGLPNGLIGRACAEAFASLNKGEAHDIYVKALRTRRIQLPTANFLTNLPISLRAVGCATPLSQRQQSAVAELLTQPIPVSLA
jgi:hypothetical protein